MYSKFFTRLFLLIGMIGLFSVPLRAEEVTIGSGTTTNAWLPSHSYYKYSLTQQIYTADEIGGAGTINSIAFYNGGSEKTRTYDIYLVNTEKSSFSGSSDWVSVSSNDLVFSGSVTILKEWNAASSHLLATQGSYRYMLQKTATTIMICPIPGTHLVL